MEHFPNNASAVLNMGGTLSSGATTITVTSQVNVPTSGTFRALIDSEYIQVTAVSGNNWTAVRGTEGSSAVSHADATVVYVLLTEQSFDSITPVQQNGTEIANRRKLNFINATVADNSGNASADITLTPTAVGGTSSLPSAAPGNKNQLYLPNDGPIIERSDGTVWVPYGPLYPLTKPPAVASWTWVNQGSATAVDSNAGTFLQCDLVNSDNWRMLVKTSNSTPWTITAAFIANLCGNKDSRISLIARDSVGGKFVVWGINYDSFNNEFKLAISQYNSATSGNANIFFQRLFIAFPVLWVRVTDDGTNRTYYISVDGVNWTSVYSEGRTTFVTTNQYGWGMNPGGSAGFPVAATLLSWKES